MVHQSPILQVASIGYMDVKRHRLQHILQTQKICTSLSECFTIMKKIPQNCLLVWWYKSVDWDMKNYNKRKLQSLICSNVWCSKASSDADNSKVCIYCRSSTSVLQQEETFTRHSGTPWRNRTTPLAKVPLLLHQGKRRTGPIQLRRRGPERCHVTPRRWWWDCASGYQPSAYQRPPGC